MKYIEKTSISATIMPNQYYPHRENQKRNGIFISKRRASASEKNILFGRMQKKLYLRGGIQQQSQ